jgi:hypothetical protein
MDSSFSSFAMQRQSCSLDTRAILESVKFGRKSQILHPTMAPKSCALCPKQSQQVLDGLYVIIHRSRRIGFGCRAVRREVCRCIQQASSPRASRLPHPAALAARVDVVHAMRDLRQHLSNRLHHFKRRGTIHPSIHSAMKRMDVEQGLCRVSVSTTSFTPITTRSNSLSNQPCR